MLIPCGWLVMSTPYPIQSYILGYHSKRRPAM
jgi:hypothetical protein